MNGDGNRLRVNEARMRTGIGGVALLTALLIEVPALAHDELDGIRACLQQTKDADRLSCFDREVRKLSKPTFEGRLNVVTDPFTIDRPTLLRFQSDGVIFVLYLKNSKDEVVQNLHIGGGGEGTFLIAKPGTYFLQINGSENWRIWLEPQIVSSPVQN